MSGNRPTLTFERVDETRVRISWQTPGGRKEIIARAVPSALVRNVAMGEPNVGPWVHPGFASEPLTAPRKPTDRLVRLSHGAGWLSHFLGRLFRSRLPGRAGRAGWPKAENGPN